MKEKYIYLMRLLIDRIAQHKCYPVALFCLWVCYFANVYVTSLFRIVADYLSACSQTAFAVGVIILVLLVTLLLIVKIVENERYIAHRTIAVVSFFAVVYLYYRLFDRSFVFWGFPPYFVWMDLLMIPYSCLLIVKFAYRKQLDTDKSKSLMVSDNPIEDFCDDAFGYEGIVKTMLGNLESMDLSNESFSVGIVGSWGQGKSSFLNLFCKKAIEKKGIVVRFNPRSVKNKDEIQSEFFSLFSAELGKYHTGIKHYIRDYAVAIGTIDESWFGQAANVIASFIPNVKKRLINNAINIIDRRVYVIIEDLDRLTADEIIEVLKLIDVNGDFCNTIFMTAYDKSYVNAILNKYLTTSASQEYTDKYFNYEYTLPIPTKDALKSFFSDYLKKNVSLAEDDILSQEDMLNIWEDCSDFIIGHLRTMRHIKRFANLFISRFPIVKNDVDMKDFLYVTLLRYTDISTYSALCEGKLLTNHEGILCQSEKTNYILQAIGAKSSKEILYYLFPDTNAVELLGGEHNRAKWVDNVGKYISDIEETDITNSEGMKLFRIKEDTEAFGLVDEYLRNGYSKSLYYFLRSRTSKMIGSPDGLMRLTKLVLYIYKKVGTEDYYNFMHNLMSRIEFGNYKNAGIITDERKYKNTVADAMKFILKYAPFQIGLVLIKELDYLFETQTNNLLFSTDELINIAEQAQEKYYQTWGEEDFDFESALRLSQIRVGSRKRPECISPKARQSLLSLMTQHPREFADSIVEPKVFHDKLTLKFSDVFENLLLFPVDKTDFEEWINDKFKDNNKIGIVLNLIRQTPNHMRRVPALKSKYKKGDFDGFFEAISVFMIS